MIRYVPFLKAKRNEIKAIGELAPDVAAAICPFFDFPRKMGGYEEAEFAAAVDRVARSLQLNLPEDYTFYLDNFDVEEALRVGGQHNYAYLLNAVAGLDAIPVVGLDRSAAHRQSVVRLKRSGVIASPNVALRLSVEDFEDFAVVANDLATELAPVFAEFESVHLVFDTRICTELDPTATALQIQQFSRRFCAAYPVRRVIVTGSSIPASISDILRVDSVRMLPRHELAIYAPVRANHAHAPLVFGDYATVSPNYSDVSIAPEIMQNVMTAKLTYTIDGAHYFIRGGGMRANGAQQYFAIARTLCTEDFFRGRGYSAGDAYLEQKSRGQGGNCGPNTVIKPAVVAHITYMVREAPI